MAAKKRAVAKKAGPKKQQAPKRAAPKKAAPKKAAPKKAAKRASAPQRAAKRGSKARGGRRGDDFLLKQISPFRPDPTRYARYQVIQNGLEVGWVQVKGYTTTQCIEVWQLYKTNATGHGPGEYGFQRGYYMYPSYQNNQTESTDVTTRYVFRMVTPSLITPPGLVNGTNFQTINAVCS